MLPQAQYMGGLCAIWELRGLMQKVGTTLGSWEAGGYYLCPAADLGSKSDLGVLALEGHAPVFHDG